ncbi:MAG: hypothetical protein MUC60_11800 [Oscillatoria sp. Prado101]|nr:hypothetical protein [Oscillatoria sp. Prado101]
MAFRRPAQPAAPKAGAICRCQRLAAGVETAETPVPSPIMAFSPKMGLKPLGSLSAGRPPQ